MTHKPSIQSAEQPKRDGFYRFVIKPVILANAFVFGLAATEARNFILKDLDPTTPPPVTIALTMKAMGANYDDMVGVNPKSLAHAFVSCSTWMGDVAGKLGMIVLMKGGKGLTIDHTMNALPNKADQDARKVAQARCGLV